MLNWKSGLLLACAGTLPLLAGAQAPQKIETINVQDVALKARQIPVETFFRRAEFNQMILSPSGDKLAAVSPLKGRGNLVVIDLNKRTRPDHHLV